jgi:hypothetical protein
MVRWCGNAKATPTSLAVVTMETNRWGAPHVEAFGTMLVCRQPDGTLRSTPGPKSSVSHQNRQQAGYWQDSVYGF